MKKKIISILIAASIISITTLSTFAQYDDFSYYQYMEGGGAPAQQHPDTEMSELATPSTTATPGTTEDGDGSDETPDTTENADGPDETPDDDSTGEQQELEAQPQIAPFNFELDTFAIGGDGTVAKLVADNHVLMLRGDGRLLVWGDNTYGQLGLGSAAPTTIYDPTELTYFKDKGMVITDIAVIEDASFVLLSSGELYSFGKGMNGRLGLGSTNNAKEPTLIPNSQSLRFSEIYTGKDFVITESDDNKLYAWGRNTKGQLGTGDKNDASSPVKIMDNANVKQLTLGEDFATLLKQDNSYSVWGNNESGRYGFNTAPGVVGGAVTKSGACTNPANSICTTASHVGSIACAISSPTSYPQYWVQYGNCAGDYVNSYAAYGGTKGAASLAITTNESLVPKKVVNGANKAFPAINTIATNGTYQGTLAGVSGLTYSFTSSANSSHTHNYSYLMKPVGDPLGACSPLSAGGANTTVAATWTYTAANAFSYFDTGKIIDLQLGNKHGIVNIDGTFYGWGDNSLKQQGTSGNASGYMVPLTQINTFAKNLDDTGDGFNHLIVAGDTGYILSSGGNVYAWGANTNGKAGLGSASYIDTPTQIAALTGKSIAAIIPGRNTAYYIGHDGSVYASGDNLYGQSGLGEAKKDISKITTPEKVEDLKFSATELPPDAPDSMDAPHEVEAGDQITIQWSTVSSATGYVLTRYTTPRQATFSVDEPLLFASGEETSVVYNGDTSSFTDTALSDWNTVAYSVKALNYIGDYSPAKTSHEINVLEGSGGTDEPGGNNDGNNNNNNNGGNNNNGSGLTYEELLLLLASINGNNGGLSNDHLAAILAAGNNNGNSEELITAILAANKRNNGSGDVNLSVPATTGTDKDLLALIAAMAAQRNNTGQAVPGTNVYNQPTDLAPYIELLGANEQDTEQSTGSEDLLNRALTVAVIKLLMPEPTPTAAPMEPVYYPPQQDNTNKQGMNIAVISAIFGLVLLGVAVKFIPEALRVDETD